MKIEENFNLRDYNTFGIDCYCKYFIRSEREEDFLELVSSYELKPEEILLLGGGSNFLFTENFDGTIIYPMMQGIKIVEEDETEVKVRVGAGVVWDDFVAWAVEHEFWGVENLSLIPGHVGASPVQNIGAYGVEAKDIIFEVEAIDIEKARKVILAACDCDFAYRDSVFKHGWKNKYIITYVVFKLSKRPLLKLDYGSVRSELEKQGGKIGLADIREAIIRIRNSKLPDVKVLPNAGSFFKNPAVDREFALRLKEKYADLPVYPAGEDKMKLAAGWLIEQCGWKGKSLGKAGVHCQQALVLVNLGNATGLEIVRLANEVKKSVFLKFNVWLEPEVNII